MGRRIKLLRRGRRIFSNPVSGGLVIIPLQRAQNALFCRLNYALTKSRGKHFRSFLLPWPIHHGNECDCFSFFYIFSLSPLSCCQEIAPFSHWPKQSLSLSIFLSLYFSLSLSLSLYLYLSLSFSLSLSLSLSLSTFADAQSICRNGKWTQKGRWQESAPYLTAEPAAAAASIPFRKVHIRDCTVRLYYCRFLLRCAAESF
jgi:hypothetical protein